MATSAWIVQQLREAFPYDSTLRYLILDRGSNFNEEVIDTVKSFGIQPKQPASAVRGRTAWPSAGSATADAICLTM